MTPRSLLSIVEVLWELLGCDSNSLPCRSLPGPNNSVQTTNRLQ